MEELGEAGPEPSSTGFALGRGSIDIASIALLDIPGRVSDEIKGGAMGEVRNQRKKSSHKKPMKTFALLKIQQNNGWISGNLVLSYHVLRRYR